MNDIILTLMALAPAIALCFYIYKKDKTEKEPIRLLLQLFCLGIATIAPAIFLENLFGKINDSVFTLLIRNGIINSYEFFKLTYAFSKAFFVVALVEEGLKWIALRIGIYENKHFNSFFDGIIYSVFVSLGFAAFENVQYVVAYGFKTAVMRAVLSVPAHMFFSVFMGYFFSLYIIDTKAIRIEKALRTKGILPHSCKHMQFSHNGLLSLIIPVFIHGFYDFCLFYSTTVTSLLFSGLMIFLYVFCFGKIHKTSISDLEHSSIIAKMINSKYPHLDVTEENAEV